LLQDSNMPDSDTQPSSQARVTRRFPAGCVIHSPALGGVRLTAKMGERLRALGDYSGPLIAIEDGQQFRAITWEPWNPRIGRTRPDILLTEDGWQVTFPEGSSPRDYPPASSLAQAVAECLLRHK
jgi:hypothetical protein